MTERYRLLYRKQHILMMMESLEEHMSDENEVIQELARQLYWELNDELGKVIPKLIQMGAF